MTLNTCIPKPTPYLITTYACLQGCLFGPPVSKWIAFLSRLHFATPTKSVIYRVRIHLSHIAIPNHQVPTIHRLFWTKRLWHPVRSFYPTTSINCVGAQSTWQLLWVASSHQWPSWKARAYPVLSIISIRCVFVLTQVSGHVLTSL